MLLTLLKQPSHYQVPDTVTLEAVGCPMGCPPLPADELVLRGRDRLHGLSGIFPVTRCSTCDLLYTSVRPTPDTIGHYYPASYGPHQIDPTPKSSTLLRKLFNDYSHELPAQTPGRLLEVGAASGTFLAEMRDKGWDGAGIEPSDAAASTARASGLDVQSATLESATLTGQFDLICAFMAVEHLHDPLAGLAKLRGVIAQDGWLVLSVPDAGAWELSAFGADWYALHLPAHLTFFTPKTISAMLLKAGWHTERVLHQRNLMNVAGSLGNWLATTGKLPRLACRLQALPDEAPKVLRAVLHPLACAMAAVGQTGRMTVWARPAHSVDPVPVKAVPQKGGHPLCFA